MESNEKKTNANELNDEELAQVAGGVEIECQSRNIIVNVIPSGYGNVCQSYDYTNPYCKNCAFQPKNDYMTP